MALVSVPLIKLTNCRKMNMNYKFIARSVTDPNGDNGGLGYLTRELAEAHCEAMNELRLEYDTNPIWNKEFWSSQPGGWKVYEV